MVASWTIIGFVACKKKPADTTTTGAGAGSTPIASRAGSNSNSGSGSGPGAAVVPIVAPEARARGVLQHQIDAALKNDHAEFNGTFAPDAVVFVPGKGPMSPDDDTSGELGGTGPDGGKITKSTIAKLVANGTADAVWFYAEVTVAGDGPTDVPATTRVVELVAADKDWHTVAASFDAPQDIHPSGDNKKVPDATPPDGSLAKLVAPSALAAALAPDAIIVGAKATTDIAALKALEPLTIYKSAKEVHAPAYGFVQATLDHPRPGASSLIARTSSYSHCPTRTRAGRSCSPNTQRSSRLVSNSDYRRAQDVASLHAWIFPGGEFSSRNLGNDRDALGIPPPPMRFEYDRGTV